MPLPTHTLPHERLIIPPVSDVGLIPSGLTFRVYILKIHLTNSTNFQKWNIWHRYNLRAPRTLLDQAKDRAENQGKQRAVPVMLARSDVT